MAKGLSRPPATKFAVFSNPLQKECDQVIIDRAKKAADEMTTSAPEGRCPNCSHWYGWVGSEEGARLILVGETALCVNCRKQIVAAPRTGGICQVCACILTDQSRYAGHPDICTPCFEQKQKLEAMYPVETPKYCPRCGHIPACELHACFFEDDSDRLAKLEQDLQEERGRHQHTRFALAAKEQALEESLTYINNQGWKAEMDKANVAYRALEARLFERLKKHDETLNKWNGTIDVLAKVQDGRDNLKDNLATAHKTIANLNEVVARAAHWEADCAAAKTELEEHKRSGQILHQNLIRAEIRLSEARGMFNKSEEELAEQRALAEAFKEKVAYLEKEAVEWKASLDKSEEELGYQRAFFQALKENSATLQSDRDAFEKELHCVQETAKKDDEARVAIIKDREMTMAVKDDHIRELETELTFVARDAAANEDYAKSASAKLAEMEDKLEAGIKQEHTILEKAMQEARREIARLNETNDCLRSRDKRISEAAQEIERVKETNNNLRAEREKLHKQFEGIKSFLDSVAEARDTYKNDSIRYSNEIAEANDEAKTYKKGARMWFIMWLIQAIAWFCQFLAWRYK